MAAETTLKLRELADAAGVSPRTVRYYIAQGLLPSPGRLGANTRYGADHLGRLRLIRQLQEEHLPLAEIRARLEHLTDADLAESTPASPAFALASMLRPVQPRIPAYGAARSEWERIVLSPDVELHVRRPHSAATDRLVTALERVARGRSSE